MRITPRRVLFLLLVIVAVVVFLRMRGGPEVAEGSALVVELRGEYVEAPQAPFLARLLGRARQPFLPLIANLAKAERDDRLEAVILRVGGLDVGWGKAQEIRDAVERLREEGRRTIAYLELERFGAHLEYYVASAADEVVMAPGSSASLVGLAAEYFFLGGLWHKLGIELEVEREGRYKSAAEQIAGTGMSEPTREMENALLDSIEQQLVGGIADRRGMTEPEVRAVIDAAPARPEEFLGAGLVDRVEFFDEVLEGLGDPPVIRGERYQQVPPGDVGYEPEARFALVYGAGPVVTGQGEATPGGGAVMASDPTVRAIQNAADDPGVRAILFRIDSPGGSALASDLVWRALREASERKPVVASFSDVAASGGYYVACGANAVVSHPGTLTGSIGVFVLRPVVAGLLRKLDIGFETLTRGKHADLLLGTEPLSAATRQRLETEVASIYDRFLERVSTGRELEIEQVADIAQGRVWTGAQALERGLVDEAGGLRTAVDVGRKLAGLAEDADVELVLYPPPKTLAEQIAQAIQGRVGALAAAPELPLPRPLRRMARWLAAAPPLTPVLLPPRLAEIH